MTFAYPMQHQLSSVTPQVLARYRTATLIETGTNVGHGVAAALEAGFARVISIEAHPGHHETARARFLGRSDVELILGDSPAALTEVLARVGGRATVYLDAHSAERNPLLEELAALAAAPRRDHVILVDDVRMFGTPDWHGLTLAEAEAALLRVNARYVFGREDTANAPADLLVARLPEVAS